MNLVNASQILHGDGGLQVEQRVFLVDDLDYKTRVVEIFEWFGLDQESIAGCCGIGAARVLEGVLVLVPRRGRSCLAALPAGFQRHMAGVVSSGKMV